MSSERPKQQCSVARLIWPIVLTQACTSAAVGLNLTIAALAAVLVTGRENLGGLAQTSTILGATLITVVATRLAARADRLLSLRCTIVLAMLGSVVCSIAVAFSDRLGWILFVGLFLLGGGTVSTLTSRFVAAEKLGPNEQTSSAIGIVLFGSAAGSVIGPNLYGLVSAVTESAMQIAFLGSAAVFGLGLIPLSVEQRKDYTQNLKSHDQPDAGMRISWRPSYSRVFFVAIIAHSVMVSLMTMAPLYTDRAFGPSGSGVVMTAHLLGMYALGPLVSIALTKFGVRCMTAIGAALLVLSTCTLIFFHAVFALFILGLFGIGLGWSVGMLTSSSEVSKVATAGERVALQGRLDIWINLAAGVSSICSGVVVAAVGYANLAIVVLTIAVSATALYALFERARQS